MEKDAARNKAKDDRDSTKPGTIVAGPEAHAREGAGKAPSDKAPSDKGGKPAGENDGKP